MGLRSFFRNLFGSTPVVVDPKEQFFKEAEAVLKAEQDPFEGLKIVSRTEAFTSDLKKETPPFNPITTEQSNKKFNELLKGEKKKRTINSTDAVKTKAQQVKQPKIKKDYSSYQTSTKKEDDGLLSTVITGMIIESMMDDTPSPSDSSYSSDTSSGFDSGFGGGDFSGGGSGGDF